MPFYKPGNGEYALTAVEPGTRRLTVVTDIDQPDCDLTLHSGENRVVKVATGAGVLADDLELDPEVFEVRVTPTAGGPTPIFITLHPSR